MTEMFNINGYYWQRKVKRVSLLSKEMGSPSLNEEFWNKQPCVVISLLLKSANIEIESCNECLLEGSYDCGCV